MFGTLCRRRGISGVQIHTHASIRNTVKVKARARVRVRVRVRVRSRLNKEHFCRVVLPTLTCKNKRPHVKISRFRDFERITEVPQSFSRLSTTIPIFG